MAVAETKSRVNETVKFYQYLSWFSRALFGKSGVVAHTCNSNPGEAVTGRALGFPGWPANLAYLMTSRPVRNVFTKQTNKQNQGGAGEMARWIKVVSQAWRPKFGSRNPRRGERRELTPQKLFSDTTCALQHTPPLPIVTHKQSF